ncbi:hypothetical protein SDRG_11311 [Saprolegnia diclina VS20]|uniref:Uncharacterized protein n=1 Tax=Saprolegnia diclina (strain VS20) TaxID=1156394 RepID=T0Q8Z3_SAPDV|nr:hypothetical protein SDRG_11311 [Saprolegnia diclina VS20]EQC31126.1 hypothetical protein SDRG_11311 [Saprolegnia diclina VS20]|eukprot:XP_008615565.1 hypothetical protein SDRG_11311 [Saprolegnia diclina VS20]
MSGPNPSSIAVVAPPPSLVGTGTGPTDGATSHSAVSTESAGTPPPTAGPTETTTNGAEAAAASSSTQPASPAATPGQPTTPKKKTPGVLNRRTVRAATKLLKAQAKAKKQASQKPDQQSPATQPESPPHKPKTSPREPLSGHAVDDAALDASCLQLAAVLAADPDAIDDVLEAFLDKASNTSRNSQWFEHPVELGPGYGGDDESTMRERLVGHNKSLEWQGLFSKVAIILKQYGTRGTVLTLATQYPEVSQTLTHMSFTLTPPGGRMYLVPAKSAYAHHYYVTFRDLADPFLQRAAFVALFKLTRNVLQGFCPTQNAVIAGSSYRVLFNQTAIPAALLLGDGQTAVFHHKVHMYNSTCPPSLVVARNERELHRERIAEQKAAAAAEKAARAAAKQTRKNANDAQRTDSGAQPKRRATDPAQRQDAAAPTSSDAAAAVPPGHVPLHLNADTMPDAALANDSTSPDAFTMEGAGQDDMDLGGADDGQDVVVTSIDASAGLYTRSQVAASTSNMFDAFADTEEEEEETADAEMDPDATDFLPHFRARTTPAESHGTRNRSLGKKKVTAAELAKRAATTTKKLIEAKSGDVSVCTDPRTLLAMVENEPDVVNAVMFNCRRGGATSFAQAQAIRRAIVRTTQDPALRGPALDQMVATQPADARTMAQMFAAAVDESERAAALALAGLDLVFRLRGRDVYDNDALLAQILGEPVLRTPEGLLSDKSLLAVVTHPQFAPQFTALKNLPKMVGGAFDTLLALFVDSAPNCDVETGALCAGALAPRC